jgi:PIN domain nuclease of toxin-antitoxin system
VKLLLDTHIWIWSRGVSERLAPRVARALEDSAIEVWLSPVSIWEFYLLVDKGRIAVSPEPEVWLKQALSAPLKEAPLTREVAMATRTIRLPHRDPADLFLAATAQVFDLTLVTADVRLLNVEGISTFSNL